jgi:hypothetical protein
MILELNIENIPRTCYLPDALRGAWRAALRILGLGGISQKRIRSGRALTRPDTSPKLTRMQCLISMRVFMHENQGDNLQIL